MTVAQLARILGRDVSDLTVRDVGAWFGVDADTVRRYLRAANAAARRRRAEAEARAALDDADAAAHEPEPADLHVCGRPGCNHPYTPKHVAQLYCSPRCQTAATSQRHRDRQRAERNHATPGVGGRGANRKRKRPPRESAPIRGCPMCLSLASSDNEAVRV